MRCIFILLILCGLGELSVGISQGWDVLVKDYPYYTVCGTFSNPAPFSILIALIFPIAWFYVLQYKELFSFQKGLFSGKIEIILSCCYLLISLFVLTLSMSRTSWIAIIIACSIMSYKHFEKGKRNVFSMNMVKKHVRISIFVIFTLVCISGFYLLKRDSADGRMFIWKISSYVVTHHFISGVGGGHFSGAYGEMQEQYFRSNKGTEHEKNIAGAPEYAFNEYLQIIIEYGITGILIFIIILGYTFYHLERIKNYNKTPIIGSLISLLIIAFFSYPFRNLYTCLLAIFIVALAVFLPNEKMSIHNSIIRHGFLSPILFIIIYKTCICFGFLGTIKTAYNQWNSLKPYFDAEQFDKITQNYATLYPYLKSNAEYLFEYGQCLSKTGKYFKSNQILSEGLHLSSDPMFLNIIGKNYQQFLVHPTNAYFFNL